MASIAELEKELESARQHAENDPEGGWKEYGDAVEETLKKKRALEDDEQRAHNAEREAAPGVIKSDPPNNPAEQIGDAAEAVEEAAAETVEAAADAGKPELAEEVAARVIEELRRANVALEQAAEATEEVAEEVAEEAPPDSPQEEAAEEAVETAREAGEAVEEAEAAVREEVREQGGGEHTQEAAAEQAIEQEAAEVAEEGPVEEAPAVEAAGEEVAEVVADPTPQVRPEESHPYYKRRKLFGIEI